MLWTRGLGRDSGLQEGIWLNILFFVLETIRTGAMRVIHVIVKTEETQKLRMKFVLYCTTRISNTNKIYHSICQQVDTSGTRSTSPPLDSRHEDCGAEGH